MLDRAHPKRVFTDDPSVDPEAVLAGGTIHDATAAEVPALVALLRAAGGDGRDLGFDDVHALVRDGHFLVLARGDGRLGGCVHVELSDGFCYVRYLAVDPGLADPAVRDRLLGVASALCDAYQCTPV